MAEHHQLEVLRSLGAEAEHDERQDTPSYDVEDGQSQAHSLPETVESGNDSRAPRNGAVAGIGASCSYG